VGAGAGAGAGTGGGGGAVAVAGGAGGGTIAPPVCSVEPVVSTGRATVWVSCCSVSAFFSPAGSSALASVGAGRLLNPAD
jgi:hypothetical protein